MEIKGLILFIRLLAGYTRWLNSSM